MSRSFWLIWHEGALGDLLLSRFVITAIKLLSPQKKLFLAARSESRFLLEEMDWVDKSFSTEFAGSFIKNFPVEKIFLFASHSFLPLMFKKERLKEKVKIIPTRPSCSLPLAIEQINSLISDIKTKRKFLSQIFSSALQINPFFEKSPQDLIVLHPGSGAIWKRAPFNLFVKLYHFFQSKRLDVIFLVGPAERDLLNFLASFKFLYLEDIKETWKFLSSVRLFIGNDSGISHLAAALGIPSITLFGPTSWENWFPMGKKSVVLATFCECRSKGKDPRLCKDPCLSKISYQSIINISQALLGINQNLPPMKTLEVEGVVVGGVYEFEE